MPSVLITGTSTGIGLLTAVELARRGWHVYATMRDPARSGALERMLAEAGVAGQVEIIPLDVADVQSMQTAVAAVLQRSGGKLDAVVHNAGVGVAGAFEDISDADLRKVMETNFFGVMALTRALLPTFRAQRRGRIVVVSSEAAFFSLPANSIYSASKWAIEGWAEFLVFEVSPFGIDVILVEPGPYRTEIWSTTPRVRPAGSAYGALVDQMFTAGDRHASVMARDPLEVARKIASALATDRPRFRYPVGLQSNLTHLMRGKIPTRLFQWVVRRYLGLNRVRV